MVQAIFKEIIEIIVLILGMIIALQLIWVVGKGIEKLYDSLLSPVFRIFKNMVRRNR